MELLEKMKLSDTQLRQLEAGKPVEIKATWDEFMDFASESRFKADYHSGHIIVMGLAKLVHEFLVMQLGALLSSFFKMPEYLVLGSNLGIAIPEVESYYNADVTVIKGVPQFKDNSEAIITNPHIIVEILSKSTMQYDLHEKMIRYSRLESLQEVVFVNYFDKWIDVRKCTDNPKVWIQTIYDDENDVILIDTMTVLLKEIFANLPATIQ